MVEDTQKRYADDVTVQKLVRLRVENERLREALHRISHAPNGKVYCSDGHEEAVLIARSALQPKGE